ncbi:hypothetical protein BCR32DRAFT_248875, partial [Anaeromyces robustus]
MLKLKTKNIFFLALLTLCFYVGMGQCEFGKNLKYAKSPTGEDLICVYKFGILRNCYPRVFKPTHEYQVILEGQDIPKGLDVQISMRTGERRAKLPDNYEEILAKREEDKKIQQYKRYQDFLRKQQEEQNQKYNEYLNQRQYQKAQQIQDYQEYLQQKQIQQQQEFEEYLNRKRIQEAQQKQKYQQYQEYLKQQQQQQQREEEIRKARQAEYAKREAQQYQEYLKKLEEKEKLEKLEKQKLQSHEIVMVNNEEEEGQKEINNENENQQQKVHIHTAFGSLSKAKTLEEKIEILEQIEDIVHHIEFGQELMKSLPEFINYLKDENNKIRALSAICIGSSLQNNPKARKTAIKQHLYDILIERLTNEKDVMVLKRLCYAFSNLVRGDTKMIKKLHKSKNLGLLYHLYMSQPSLRNKLETFITDIFDP